LRDLEKCKGSLLRNEEVMEDFVIKEKKNENKMLEIQKEIKEKNNKIDDKNQKLKYLSSKKN